MFEEEVRYITEPEGLGFLKPSSVEKLLLVRKEYYHFNFFQRQPQALRNLRHSLSQQIGNRAHRWNTDRARRTVMVRVQEASVQLDRRSISSF